jgi:hypothetical protein
MSTQQHANEIPQRAQAPSPVKEHRRSDVLFSILGVALPLVAGSMVWWPWRVPYFFDAQWVLYTVLLAALMSVAVGVFLLRIAFRAWWVAMCVAAAWIVGEFLGAVVHPLVEGGWPTLQAQDYFWGSQAGCLLALLPLLLCAGLAALVALARMSDSRQ